MAKEIELKFLVDDVRCIEQATVREDIVQGYLVNTPAKIVRVRIIESGVHIMGYLCIKIATDNPRVRDEFEFEIDYGEASQLLRVCDGIIEKTRFRIPYGTMGIFEVDLFKGKNQPLVLAELEFPSEEKANEWRDYLAPKWLGKEVTNDYRYTNAHLAQFPYSTWENLPT